MTKVAVTGATGHVGANLVRQLLDRGDQVRVLVRDAEPEALSGLDVEQVAGDVRQPETLRPLFDGIEVVYHLAAVISIVGDRGGLVPAVNVDGARHAGQAALDAGVKRFIHMCSVHAFEHRFNDTPFDVDRARVGPSGPAYDYSKAGGEAAIRELIDQGLDAVILHPSGIIGPVDFAPSRMGQVFLDLYHRRLPALIDGGFDFVDVRDVAASAIAATEHGKTGRSYMVTGHYHDLPELGRLARSVTGIEPPRFTCPYPVARMAAPALEAWAKWRGTEPLYTRESVDVLQTRPRYLREQAARDLGHRPRPTRASIADVYDWFARRGALDDKYAASPTAPAGSAA